MTTGMSAPPIGRTIVIPKIRAAAMISRRTGELTLPANRKSAPPTAIAARARVTIRPPGIMIGLPAIRPWSLPLAMSEPVNVTLPMITSRTTAIVVSRDTARPRCSKRR